MARMVYGPQYAGVVVSAAPHPDVIIVPSPIGAVDRTVTVTVPAFDPATSNVPTAIHACYVLAAPDPATAPAAFLATVDPTHVGHSTAIVPGDISITVPGVTAGSYFVQIVVEYEI